MIRKFLDTFFGFFYSKRELGAKEVEVIVSNFLYPKNPAIEVKSVKKSQSVAKKVVAKKKVSKKTSKKKI